ncbi:phenylalanyl-tRNA synthetase beta chain [Streptacidiphilus sp. MAP12-20]|uniref:phenylalanine--tRNA ligase subunit beta-related protein n=1 Tax=Streptacidiphilus sp. MAP12-20 TaxID=3156299 RepID=UPI0035179C3B
MRIPVSWLNEFLRRPLTAREINDLLGEAGITVTGADNPGVLSPKVLVGRVEGEPPDAGGLIQVALPGREPVGLPGADVPAAGALVAVALPGARLFAAPGTVAGGLRRLRLSGRQGRGVGVLCSEAELGLGPAAEVLLLPEGAPPGVPVSAVLPTEQAEELLSLRIPETLPHCRGLWGLALEIDHRLTGAGELPNSATRQPGSGGGGRGAEALRLQVTAPDVTVGAALLDGLRPDALPEPDWRRAELAGLAAAPGVLDRALLIAGYEYGVRLAAYWLPAQRPVTVSVGPGAAQTPPTAAGELDGLTVRLTAVPVARPAAGARLLVLAATATDLAPGGERCSRAVARVARLLAAEAPEAAGVGSGPESPRRTVGVDLDRLRRVTGTALDAAQCAALLETIDGRGAAAEPGLLLVSVPPSRPDLRGEQELVAELVRLLGFRAVPASLPTDPVTPGDDRRGRQREVIRRTLTARQCREAMTPLVVEAGAAPDTLGQGHWLDPAVALADREGSPPRFLRRSLVPGLARADAVHGDAAGLETLFELGTVVLPGGGPLAEPVERTALALLAPVPPGPDGPDGLWPRGWEVELGRLLGTCRAVVRALQLGPLRAVPVSDPTFHPGTAALLLVGQAEAGRLGALRHCPSGLPARAGQALLAAELDLDLLLSLPERPSAAQTPPRFPEMQRDLSLPVPDGLAVADLLTALQQVGPPLRTAELADVYRDPGTGGRVLTVRLTFGSPMRTLGRDETAQAVEQVRVAARRAGALPR